MGAWGVGPFENDTANDWAYQLESSEDLSLLEEAVERAAATVGEFLDADEATEAVAACEVIARLRGRPGPSDGYTEKVDAWVATHRALVPQPALLRRAAAALDRVLGEDSELRDLWDSSDAGAWRASIADLRQRLKG